MNPNQPPDPPANGPAGGDGQEGSYYIGPQAALDANAPVLDQREAQRLNRKALVFIGFILLLVFAIIFAMMRWSSKPEEAPKVRQVSAPKLPESLQVNRDPPLPLPPPPEQAPQQAPPLPMQEPPPLPVLPQGPGDSASAAGGGRSAARKPTLVERRIAGLRSGSGQAGAAPAPAGSAGASAARVGRQAAEVAARLPHPDTLLIRGTYLRCVLETRIITTVDGYTSCVLTEPVYSFNGRHLLLPKGTKIFGSYKAGDDQDRVPVVWDRVVTPAGLDVAISSPGVDNLGGAGHPGHYNAHWGSRVMSALLISLLSDGFKWAAAEHGPRNVNTITGTWGATVIDSPFQSATAKTMEELAAQALSKSARRRPTVTINQGSIINIYVAKDVDFTNVLLAAQ